MASPGFNSQPFNIGLRCATARQVTSATVDLTSNTKITHLAQQTETPLCLVQFNSHMALVHDGLNTEK